MQAPERPGAAARAPLRALPLQRGVGSAAVRGSEPAAACVRAPGAAGDAQAVDALLAMLATVEAEGADADAARACADGCIASAGAQSSDDALQRLAAAEADAFVAALPPLPREAAAAVRQRVAALEAENAHMLAQLSAFGHMAAELQALVVAKDAALRGAAPGPAGGVGSTAQPQHQASTDALAAALARNEAGTAELRRQVASFAAPEPRAAPHEPPNVCAACAARPSSNADARVAAAAERAAVAEAAAAAAAKERDALRAALADAEAELAATDAQLAPLRLRLKEQDGVLLELMGATPAKAASSPLGVAWTRRLLAEQQGQQPAAAVAAALRAAAPAPAEHAAA